MPATRVPTEIHRLSGQLAARPQRFAEQGRANEPTPTGPLGDPPEGMTKAQKSMWQELASELPPGVAGNCDRTLFELAVRLRTLVRAGKATGMQVGHLITCIREMGMTPVTRSKVRAKVEAEQDEWEADFGPETKCETTTPSPLTIVKPS